MESCIALEWISCMRRARVVMSDKNVTFRRLIGIFIEFVLA